MTARNQEQYVTIAQSATVSGILSIKNVKDGCILYAPAVTSCRLEMQGSFDTTSANFKSVLADDNETRWVWGVGAGSNAVPLVGVQYFPFLRLEADIAQADVRTFTVGVKL